MALRSAHARRGKEHELTGSAVVVICVGIVLWVALARRLGRADLTAPMAFVVLGLAAHLVGLGLDLEAESISLMAEAALAFVLFSDAARVRPSDLRAEADLLVRLLGIGLPLAIAIGAALAHVLVSDVSGWAALLVGAALAPTDAGLGRAIVVDPAVPVRIRQTLNAESGLNDGIVTPVVSVAILAVAGEESLRAAESVGDAAREVGVGLVFGAVVAALSALLLTWALRRRWSSRDTLSVAALATAGLAFAGATTLDANGFLAAFVGGFVFRTVLDVPDDAPDGHDGEADDDALDEQDKRAPGTIALTELGGELGGYVVWFVVGAVLLPSVWGQVDATAFVYAVLSLTLVRMVAVALSLLGSGLRAPTVAFVGWFGPRGLASVVFATLAAAQLGPVGEELAAVIVVTVGLSVVAHGVSASPLARRYGAWVARSEPVDEMREAAEPVARGTMQT